MMSKHNFEPAFPRNYDSDGHNGMTLRDYFAAKAMQAAFTGSVVNKELDDRHVIAKVAYLLADAMLEARK